MKTNDLAVAAAAQRKAWIDAHLTPDMANDIIQEHVEEIRRLRTETPGLQSQHVHIIYGSTGHLAFSYRHSIEMMIIARKSISKGRLIKSHVICVLYLHLSQRCNVICKFITSSEPRRFFSNLIKLVA